METNSLGFHVAHLDNLGLSKKVNKKYQGIDLDKSVENIGHSFIKRISWVKFVSDIVDFCETNNIEIAKANEKKDIPGKLYLDDLNRIRYVIVTQEKNDSSGFVKTQISKIVEFSIVPNWNLFKWIKQSDRKNEGFYVHIEYSKYKNGFTEDAAIINSVPVLIDSPVYDVTNRKEMRRENKMPILQGRITYYEFTENAARNLASFLKELDRVSKLAIKKYSDTSLTCNGFNNFLKKNLDKEYLPSSYELIDGKRYYEYKFWDSVLENDNFALGLNKKIQKKYDDKSVEDTIEEINTLDKEGFEEALVRKFSESPIVGGFEGSLAEYNTTRITLKNQWRIEDNHVWIIIQGSKFLLHFVIECNGLTTVYFPLGNTERLIEYVEKDKVKPDPEWRTRLFSECWLDFTYKNIQDALQFVESYANGNIDSFWYDESAIYRALSESKVTLGLNKKVQDKYKSKDSIVNVADKLDPETFKNLAEETLCGIQGVNQMLQAGSHSDEDIAYFGFDCDSDLYFFSRVPSREGMHGVPFLKIYNYHDIEKAMFSFYFSTKHKEENDEIETMHQFGAENKVDRYSPDNSLKFDLTYDNLIKLTTWLKSEIADISRINENMTNIGIVSKVKNKFNKRDEISNMKELLSPEDFIKTYFDRVKKDIQANVPDTYAFSYNYQPVNTTASQNFVVNLDVPSGYFYICISKFDYLDNEWLIAKISYNDRGSGSYVFVEGCADKDDIVYVANKFTEGQAPKYKLSIDMIDNIVKWMVKDSGCRDIANIPLSESYLNLGLSNKIRKRFDDKDPIADITVLDKEDFFALCGREFSKSEFVRETKKGSYNERRDWHFYYVFVDKALKFMSDVIYIRVEDNGTRFRAYASLNGSSMIYKVGAYHKYVKALNNSDLSDNEISSIIENNVYFALTYENILKLREFFEKIFKGEIDDEWFDEESIKEYETRVKIVNENNLGLNKKIQKKFNDTDAIENISIMDETTFKEFAIEYINSHTKYEFLHEITKDLRSDGLYKVSVMRFWNYEFRKGLSVFVNDSTFAIISIDGMWDNYSECFNFGECTVPSTDKIFNVFCMPENKDSHTLTPKNLKEEVRICADETLMINESDLGLNKKIQKKFNNDIEDKAVEISEMSFMEFWNEAKERLSKLSEDLGGTKLSFYPSVEDPEERKLGRDDNWMAISFKNVGRFVLVAKSRYQLYPKYKNLIEDTFHVYMTYSTHPEEHVYSSRTVEFHEVFPPIVDPDNSTIWYYKFNYYNLDKAVEWIERQVKLGGSEDRLVQMT